jgi:hypothetical protein
MIFAPVDRIDQVLDLVIEDFPLGENERREAAEKAAAADAEAAAGGAPGPPSITTEPVAMRPRP